MAKVFISWASPDRPVVDALAKRLATEGMDYWISLRDMKAGEDPTPVVMAQIREAKIAVFLLSDQIVDRVWIQRELAWCVFDQKPILPASIGPLAPEKVPELIRHLHRLDLAPGAEHEKKLDRFVKEVARALHEEEPVRFPCALFAMTEGQYADIAKDEDAWQNITTHCQKSGISLAEVDQFLKGRYGKTALDFSPFENGATMAQVVLEAVFRTNQTRRQRGRRSIRVRWYQDELMGDPKANKAARDQWASAGSLLIVDSVSVCHAAIRQSLSTNIPQPRNPELAAVLWIPPYTRHTSGLEKLTELAAWKVPTIGDVFEDYLSPKVPDRWKAFDASTRASVSDWVYRVVQSQPDDILPNQAYKQEFQNAIPSAMTSPKEFFQQ